MSNLFSWLQQSFIGCQLSGSVQIDWIADNATTLICQFNASLHIIIVLPKDYILSC